MYVYNFKELNNLVEQKVLSKVLFLGDIIQ